jgi:hypothetical protein
MIVEPVGHDQLVGDAMVDKSAVGQELDVLIGGGCAPAIGAGEHFPVQSEKVREPMLTGDGVSLRDMMSGFAGR